MNDTLTLAIIGHLVGDFLLQNDYLAKWKKIDPEVCAIHALIWTLSVMLFAGWLHRTPTSCLILSILLITHLLQDHTNIISRWMKFIGQKDFMSGPCSPWSIIVVDNVWHIVTIWAVWKFIA